MYKTQVYDGFKAETILAKVARKHHKALNLWLYNDSCLIAYVIAQPFECIDGLKNISLIGNVIIERNLSGFKIHIV